MLRPARAFGSAQAAGIAGLRPPHLNRILRLTIALFHMPALRTWVAAERAPQWP